MSVCTSVIPSRWCEKGSWWSWNASYRIYLNIVDGDREPKSKNKGKSHSYNDVHFIRHSSSSSTIFPGWSECNTHISISNVWLLIKTNRSCVVWVCVCGIYFFIFFLLHNLLWTEGLAAIVLLVSYGQCAATTGHASLRENKTLNGEKKWNVFSSIFRHFNFCSVSIWMFMLVFVYRQTYLLRPRSCYMCTVVVDDGNMIMMLWNPAIPFRTYHNKYTNKQQPAKSTSFVRLVPLRATPNGIWLFMPSHIIMFRC